MSDLKMAELAVFLGLPILAFFDKRHATGIWRLWLAAVALIFLLAILGH